MSAASQVPAKDYRIIGINAQLAQDTPEYTLNMYAEKESDEVMTLKPTPGSYPSFQFTPNGGGRGINVDTGRVFGVRGAFFQELVNGAPVIRGTLLTVQNPVAIITCLPPNGEGQVLIVDDSHGYVYKFSDNSFTTLTEADHGFVGGGSQGVFCAARGVVFKPGTTQYQCSGQYNFVDVTIVDGNPVLPWDGTAFATCNSLNTPLIALASNGGLLYCFSNDGFEVQEDMGYAIFPFGRIIFGDRVGCMAPNSVFVMKRYVYWLGNNSEGNGEFYRHITGSYPEAISDAPTQRILARTANLAQCISYGYQSISHDFAVNTFIDGSLTIVHDAETGLWHERSWRDPVSNETRPVPYINVVFFQGKFLGLSYLDGTLFTIDNNVFTDSGNPIVRKRITKVIPPEADWQTFFQSVELMAQTGNTPAGSANVQIVMRYTTDRGETWSQEQWQQAGGNGSYSARTKWTGLGAAFGMAFEFTVSCDQYISWRSFRVRAQ